MQAASRSVFTGFRRRLPRLRPLPQKSEKSARPDAGRSFLQGMNKHERREDLQTKYAHYSISRCLDSGFTGAFFGMVRVRTPFS